LLHAAYRPRAQNELDSYYRLSSAFVEPPNDKQYRVHLSTDLAPEDDEGDKAQFFGPVRLLSTTAAAPTVYNWIQDVTT